MYCTQCGTQAGEIDKYCANCGYMLKTPDEDESSASSSPPKPQETAKRAALERLRWARTSQDQGDSKIRTAVPPTRVVGRKGVKWGLRIIGFLVMAFTYLIWKEYAAVSGSEGFAMGFVRGAVVFGGYIAFWEYTKKFDGPKLGDRPDSDKDIGASRSTADAAQERAEPLRMNSEHQIRGYRNHSKSNSVYIWVVLTLVFLVIVMVLIRFVA